MQPNQYLDSCMSPAVVLKTSRPAVLLPSIAVLCGDCAPAANADDMSMPAHSSRQGQQGLCQGPSERISSKAWL